MNAAWPDTWPAEWIERVGRFVEAIKNDPRVLGIARRGVLDADEIRLVVVTTWDGGVTLPADLPRLCAPLVGSGIPIEQVRSGEPLRVPAIWEGLGVDGTRAEVALYRPEDLIPDPVREYAVALHDPKEVIARYVNSHERDRSRPRNDAAAFLMADVISRKLGPRRRLLGDGGSSHDVGRLEWALERLSPNDPAQSSLARRIDQTLRAEPGPGEGLRVRAGNDPATAFESFLKIADAEGFKGDRVLFNEATKRLHDLAKRAPVFDQGFVVPTFDAVEAGFALGEAVGGCQPPLVPGVYVGVGVTPKDALEFWAAPFVRDPTCSVACVDDTGERDVVLRTAGRDPMIATLTSVIDAAFDRLPALIDRARDATKESVDPSAVLATLHLPKTFVERAKRRGADALMCSRLTVALAVARAGHDCAPLVARKLGLAAGRVIAAR